MVILNLPIFFNVEQFPQLKFTEKKYDVNDGEGTISGDLTMHGITKPVTLNVEFGGIVTDPYGQTKAGFTVTGKISRKEFGLSWGTVTETGNVVLSDEVKINAEIQLVKQVEELVEEEQLA
jgi:polyisoprenoid-binding protein YceI